MNVKCPVREEMSRPRDFLKIPVFEVFFVLYGKITVVLDIRRCQEPLVVIFSDPL